MLEDVDSVNQRLDPTPGRETLTEQMTEIATEIATVLNEEMRQKQQRMNRLIYVLLGLLATSLLLHGLTLTRLFDVRSTLISELDRLAQGVETAKEHQLSYEIPINQSFPIDVVVPINETFVIPVQTTVDIKQDIVIPIDTGFGEINLPVPLDVSIPISTEVPITFQQDVELSTNIDLELNVPIQIDLGTPEFEQYLNDLKETLLEFRDRL